MPSNEDIINRVVVEFPVNGPGFGAFVVDTLHAKYGLAVEIHAVWDPDRRVLGGVVRGDGLATSLGTVPLGVSRNLAVALLMAVYAQSPGTWGFMSERDALECLAHLSEILADATGYRHPITDPIGNLVRVLTRYRRALADVFKLRAEVRRLRSVRNMMQADVQRLHNRVDHQRKELNDRLQERQVLRNAIRGLGLLRVWAGRLADRQAGEMANAEEAKEVKQRVAAMEWTKKYE